MLLKAEHNDLKVIKMQRNDLITTPPFGSVELVEPVDPIEPVEPLATEAELAKQKAAQDARVIKLQSLGMQMLGEGDCARAIRYFNETAAASTNVTGKYLALTNSIYSLERSLILGTFKESVACYIPPSIAEVEKFSLQPQLIKLYQSLNPDNHILFINQLTSQHLKLLGDFLYTFAMEAEGPGVGARHYLHAVEFYHQAISVESKWCEDNRVYLAELYLAAGNCYAKAAALLPTLQCYGSALYCLPRLPHTVEIGRYIESDRVSKQDLFNAILKLETPIQIELLKECLNRHSLLARKLLSEKTLKLFSTPIFNLDQNYKPKIVAAIQRCEMLISAELKVAADKAAEQDPSNKVGAVISAAAPISDSDVQGDTNSSSMIGFTSAL